MRTRGPQFHSHAAKTFSKVAGLVVDCFLRHGRRTLPDVSEPRRNTALTFFYRSLLHAPPVLVMYLGDGVVSEAGGCLLWRIEHVVLSCLAWAFYVAFWVHFFFLLILEKKVYPLFGKLAFVRPRKASASVEQLRTL